MQGLRGHLPAYTPQGRVWVWVGELMCVCVFACMHACIHVRTYVYCICGL